MMPSSKYWSGRCSPLLPLLLGSTLLLSNCTGGLPLPVGGTNVAANTQIGRENNQIAYQNTTDTGPVEELHIQQIPPWVLIALILGWLAPSPGEIGRGLSNLIRGKRDV